MGDSFTEGMTDEVVDGHYRGWANRVADELAKHHPEFTYMNTAVRGKLVGQVNDDQIPLVQPYVTGKETLVSFHAGANDVIRPRINPEVIYEKYRHGVRSVASTGCTLMLFTVMEETSGKSKTAQLWRERFHDFNKLVREMAIETNAILIDWNTASFLADRRFLAFDRLHSNAEGHWRISQGVLENLGYPFDESWKIKPPPSKPELRIKKIALTTLWFIVFALPWIWRRLRGKSSGDGRSPKHAEPVKWPIFTN